jgi:F-type H+-transporting ATPase subunit delta
VTAANYAKDEGLAHKYAQAAYQHTTQGWLSALGAVRDRLAANPTRLAELNDTEVSFTRRQERLNALLPADVRQDVRNFLYVLLREGHLDLLDDVIDDLTRLSTRGSQARAGRVTSAVPLTADEKDAFRQHVHTRFGGDVGLEFQVDPAILGGAVLRVGDKVIDGSVAGKLEALRERLVSLR